jgi:hypothetical protein
MRQLPLAYRCDRRWSEMTGRSGVVRRCGDCGCDVVNLSALDERSARELLEQQTEEKCVRYRYVRGEIVFAKMRRTMAIAAAAAVLLATTPGGADTSTPNPPAPTRRRAKEHGKKRTDGNPPAKHGQYDEDDGKILPPRF